MLPSHSTPQASTRVRLAAPLLALGLASGPAAAQDFVDNQADIPSGNPANNSLSENVDFGDVDLDGDWDAVFADGGDAGNDQNRIWINQGGLQAGQIGRFGDETSARFPSVQDDSRDIEFADIDNDGDLDIYVSNTAQITNQGNKWWINDGGTQGGTLGFYTDETAARWINLGGSGSSISPSALINGSFIDWSCDCDFGDLDNDGDLDLVHSTYGGAFSGQVPTRIFLNDGTGHFEEFNPSGFQVTGSNINNGNPAIWCEGVQQSNTTNATGAEADIASTALDIDIGDIDGDFDLDILHGARQELPRMFANRLEENGGALGFRDVTGAVFPAGYSTGGGHYEQEMGDLDNDGDIDIYGLNWGGGFGLSDVTMLNDGSGNFAAPVVLDNSASDDNEGDFFDWNNDGNLDLFVANFSGTSRVYVNDGAGALDFVPESQSGFDSISNFVALDADACDVDKDGDYDLMQSNDGGARNQLFENLTNVPDTHAPYLPNLEDPGTVTAAPGTIAVRAQVYDNAPYYITWYNDTTVDFSVNGFDINTRNARSSGGQIFRATVPANLAGNVQLTWRSEDEYGNAGSNSVSYTGNYGSAYATNYGVSQPALTTTPTIEALSVPFPGSTLFIGLEGDPNGFWFVGLASAPEIPPAPIGPFLTNIDRMTFTILGNGKFDFFGKSTVAVPVTGLLSPGDQFYMTAVTVTRNDPNPPVSGNTDGLEITVQ